MSHNWIEYTVPSPRRPDELYVSMTPKGRMVFSRRAIEALNKPEAVVLLFDPGTKSIGVRPAVGPADNGFRLQAAGPGANKLISVGGFMRKHDIRFEHTVRFPMAHLDEGVLVLDLHTRIPVQPGGRAALYKLGS